MTYTKNSGAEAILDSINKFILLFVAFSISFNINRIIKLIPSGNNYDIKTNFNFFPESNYFLILGIIISTFVVYQLLIWLLFRKSLLFRPVIILILSVSLLIGVIAPGYSKYQNNIDTFHNGEQLAPALAFEQGKTPYKEILTLRGAGEDIVTPWISFKLFGQSIGSYFLLTVLLQFITAIAFFILLSKIFKDNMQFLITTLWFTVSSYNSIYNIRDLFVWLTLLIITSIIFQTKTKKIYYGLAGFIASLSIFYSFDRGLFINLLLFILVLLTSLYDKRENIYYLQPGTILNRIKFIIPIIFGYLSGILLVVILLGLTASKYFLINTFQLSKYQGIIFNTPYSTISASSVFDWLPVMVMIVCIYTVAKQIKLDPKSISRPLIFAAILTVFGIITFRAAAGRPDSGHIAYGSPVIFIALFYIFFNSLKKWKQNYQNINWSSVISFAPLYAIVLISLSPGTTKYLSIATMNNSSLKPLKTIVSGPTKPDNFWYTNEVKTITSRISENNDANNSLFVFSSDPIYYYSTKLRNPTRYYISWFADPAELESEALTDLIRNPPKTILYESGTYYDRPEFISMKDRLPSINKWILQNYPKQTKVGKAIILTR